MDVPSPDPADDPFNLGRFVAAQESVYTIVCGELAAGCKRSHWMWFVFPQLRGLGRSETAYYYGVSGRDEARAYWLHPLLGARLVECTRLVLENYKRSAREVFGSPDDVKFRSCMTLFASVTSIAGEAAEKSSSDVFVRALDQFFRGVPDARTIELLSSR